MSTVTLSTRLDLEEAQQLTHLALDAELDRATFIKKMLRRGMAEYRIEQACATYRQGNATLSRAAELAGVSIYELLRRLPTEALTLNYDAECMQDDAQLVGRL